MGRILALHKPCVARRANKDALLQALPLAIVYPCGFSGMCLELPVGCAARHNAAPAVLATTQLNSSIKIGVKRLFLPNVGVTASDTDAPLVNPPPLVALTVH